jgi:hypothetical protein
LTRLTFLSCDRVIKRGVLCAAAVSILVCLLCAYCLGTVYVAKQAARTRFALEINDMPYAAVDERMVYVSATHSYQFDRDDSTGQLGTVYVKFAHGIHVRYDEPPRIWINIPISTLREPAVANPMVAAPPKAK